MVSPSVGLRYIQLIKKVLKEYSEMFPQDRFYSLIINYSNSDFKWKVNVISHVLPSFIWDISEDDKYVYVTGVEESLERIIYELEMYSELIIDEDYDLSDYKVWKKYEKYYPYVIKLLEKYMEIADELNLKREPTIRLVITKLGEFYLIARYPVQKIKNDSEYVNAILNCAKAIHDAYNKLSMWKQGEGIRYYMETLEEAEKNIREKLRETRRKRKNEDI